MRNITHGIAGYKAAINLIVKGVPFTYEMGGADITNWLPGLVAMRSLRDNNPVLFQKMLTAIPSAKLWQNGRVCFAKVPPTGRFAYKIAEIDGFSIWQSGQNVLHCDDYASDVWTYIIEAV